MPGLVRGMARTAAVVGTATATRNAVNRRQANKNAQAYTEAMNTATAQQGPPQEYYGGSQVQYDQLPPDTAQQEDMITQLERLGALKAQGLLTEVEFAAAKQKLLA